MTGPRHISPFLFLAAISPPLYVSSFSGGESSRCQAAGTVPPQNPVAGSDSGSVSAGGADYSGGHLYDGSGHCDLYDRLMWVAGIRSANGGGLAGGSRVCRRCRGPAMVDRLVVGRPAVGWFLPGWGLWGSWRGFDRRSRGGFSRCRLVSSGI